MKESLLPTYELIDIGALVILTIIIVGIVRGVRTRTLQFPRKEIKTLMRKRPENSEGTITRSDWLKSLASVLLLDVGTSRTLRTCHKAKWASHVSIFWGFVFTAIATTLAFFLKPEGMILPLTHPIKIFGNLGGILIVVGCAAMFAVRYQESGSAWHLNRSDFFLIALFSAAVSGFAIQQAIYAFGRSGLTTSAVYWIHIALIVLLLATSPFTKFIHALYKPSWTLYDDLERKFMLRREKRILESG